MTSIRRVSTKGATSSRSRSRSSAEQSTPTLACASGMRLRDSAICVAIRARTPSTATLSASEPAAASTSWPVMMPSWPEGLQVRQIHARVGGELAYLRRGPRPPAAVHAVVGSVADQNRRALLLPAGVDAHQQRSHRKGFALRAAEGDDPADVRAGDLDLRLVGLHGAQRLVEFDDVADRDGPLGDRGVLQALTEVGNQEVAHGRRIAFSTQSSSRSTPGNQTFSIRAGGYGVSNPVARSTGASRS